MCQHDNLPVWFIFRSLFGKDTRCPFCKARINVQHHIMDNYITEAIGFVGMLYSGYKVRACFENANDLKTKAIEIIAVIMYVVFMFFAVSAIEAWFKKYDVVEVDDRPS